MDDPAQARGVPAPSKRHVADDSTREFLKAFVDQFAALTARLSARDALTV
jgi:hypothetical protein